MGNIAGNGTGDGGAMKKVADHAKASVTPTIVSFIAVILALPPLLAGFNALGVDLIPWAPKRTVEDLATTVPKKADQSALERLDTRVAELERELWQDRLDQANQELTANPNSRAAMRDKVEAEQRLRQILRLRRSQP
jgi:hypothetical protein